jgi:hypothetical protein
MPAPKKLNYGHKEIWKKRRNGVKEVAIVSQRMPRLEQ